MNVLLVGSGGREHALAWKLRQSPLLKSLYAAPGNPGIAEEATCVGLDVKDHGAVADFCRRASVDLVVVGPEAPLVAGLADDLLAGGIKVFGPAKAAARLEGSKGFTKDLCARLGIPTAAYARVKSRSEARTALRSRSAPVVIKADGLAAGKGVTVAMTMAEAQAAVDRLFSARRGQEAVIEDFLEGDEVSFFALIDGSRAMAFGSAQDHKRAGDGDTGPNTGGMGAYSPAPIMTDELVHRTMRDIIEPTVRAMADTSSPYRGVLFAGLMITADGPKLIEYNVRFGDPECQVLMMRLDGDLLELLLACAGGRLVSKEPRWRDDAALTVVMAAKGYPGDPVKGTEIGNVARASSLDGVKVFHAGTRRDGERLIAAGGRVLNVTAVAPTIAEAQERAYRAIDLIDWPQGFCRRDIGWRALTTP